MNQFLHLFHLAASACGTKTGVLPSLYDGLKCDGDGVPQITSVSQGLVVVANVGRILIALAGGIAVIMIIAGAIYYVVSAGDSGRIKKAKDIIINTVVGLVLILTAYAVVTFIAKGF